MLFPPALLWTAVALAMLATQGYTLVANFARVLTHTYFRKTSVFGINNLPREGPVILCPNHPNMFVDPIMVITECVRHGRSPYVWAKGSLFANKFAAAVLRALGAVPVFRPRKTDVNSLEDVDSSMSHEEMEAANKRMFEHTWEVLAAGNVMLLFPEGTSYTAPKMLRLRTGVVRVATGFAKRYDQPIQIIPVGLTYFKKDSFRSEAMIEFGSPFTISPDEVSTETFKSDEKGEVKRLTQVLEEKMHAVTLNASEFASIRTARIMRRLYLNSAATIAANEEVRLTQHIVNMLEREVEEEDQRARLTRTREKVERYQEALEKLRVKDQDIVMPMHQRPLMHLFFERIVYLLILLPLGTPGLLLNMPFYLLGLKLNTLAGYVESKSMFKIFGLGVLVPVQWLFFILVAGFFFGSSYAYALVVGLPLLLYSHIRVLEESRSIVENVFFLFNIAAHADQVEALRKERSLLAADVNDLVTEFVDPKFLSAVRKSMDAATSPVHRKPATLLHLRRSASTADSLLH